MRTPLGGAALTLLLVTGCSAGSSESALADFADQASLPGSFTFSQVYRSSERVVVACAFNTGKAVQDELGFAWPDAAELTVDENEQAVVVVEGGKVVSHEVTSRRVLDLCEHPNVNFPLSIDSDAELTTVTEKWSDGSDYPVVRY